MPIRIRRDDTPDPEPAGDQAIVVTTEDEPPGLGPMSAGQAKDGGWTGDTPTQTTWAMVSCECTLTGQAYQLVFRNEGDTFVLKSIDRAVSSTTARDMGGIDGPFDWAVFQCPECGRGWQKESDVEPAWPVVFCSCRSLLCSKRGVQSRKGGTKDGWWWHCPKCGIEAKISQRLDSLDGQALKGK